MRFINYKNLFKNLCVFWENVLFMMICQDFEDMVDADVIVFASPIYFNTN